MMEKKQCEISIHVSNNCWYSYGWHTWAVEVLWYTEQLLKSEIHKNVNIHTTEQLFSNVELQNDLIKCMIYDFELF